MTVGILDALRADATLIWAVKHDDDAYSPALLRRLLERSDLVSFSEGERSYVTLEGVAPELLVRTGTLVVETHGARGVTWAFGSPDGPHRSGAVAAQAVETSDTTGAGDTFIGTLAGEAARAGGISRLGDEQLAALMTFASNAAAELLRSRSTPGQLVGAPPKETS
ncbi:PfkB family carbohydrate kinase [Naasia aerilata]|uniref:Carbohydrate kinase PfkB domain-containing protein n=1 Tax=Naasia aerilata TaxID=1162966 RepID=A0ABN6XK17_9MICO|nr:PfkB family carbohydrate kinase [Naasia aerilata]BDZ45280.1 hypothetical protein GCM10025866_11890 [Naasia aerilata]